MKKLTTSEIFWCECIWNCKLYIEMMVKTERKKNVKSSQKEAVQTDNKGK